MTYRLTDFADTVSDTLGTLHDAARRAAQQARQVDGQAWTSMHFQRLNAAGDVVGEGSFNVEPDTWPRVVWYWQG